MGQEMPKPFKHPKSGVYYYRRVVPAPLRSIIGRGEYRISLGTKDLAEAKRQYPTKAAEVDAMLAQAAGGPVVLTQQQIVALAGLWYRRELEEQEVSPGDPEERDRELDMLEAADERGKAREAVAGEVDELLKREGLLIEARSREELEHRIFWLKVNLLNTLKQRAAGDYSPDPKLTTFPAWTAPTDAPRAKAKPSGLTFTALFDAWKTERNPPARTVYEWERMLNQLKEHVGHDAPGAVTAEEIVSWKEALLANGKSPKTVENYLLTINALFNWGVKNKKLGTNPAKGITVAKTAGNGKSRLPYSDDDAKLLLTAARREKGARRWVPWLLAFSGARLEEVCQSLVSDVRKQGAIHYLDINADDPGKSLKNAGSARRVPLHPAVIAEGFLEYVASLPKDGPLFPDMAPDKFGRRGGNATKIIGRWVRKQGITDPRKAPNHSWRHRFKDECRNAGIEKAIHDALTGHASDDEGDRYGLGYSLPVLAAAVAKLPSPVDAAGVQR
jgi:integrase